jgi:hypothetical protein
LSYQTLFRPTYSIHPEAFFLHAFLLLLQFIIHLLAGIPFMVPTSYTPSNRMILFLKSQERPTTSDSVLNLYERKGGTHDAGCTSVSSVKDSSGGSVPCIHATGLPNRACAEVMSRGILWTQRAFLITRRVIFLPTHFFQTPSTHVDALLFESSGLVFATTRVTKWLSCTRSKARKIPESLQRCRCAGVRGT